MYDNAEKVRILQSYYQNLGISLRINVLKLNQFVKHTNILGNNLVLDLFTLLN